MDTALSTADMVELRALLEAEPDALVRAFFFRGAGGDFRAFVFLETSRMRASVSAELVAAEPADLCRALRALGVQATAPYVMTVCDRQAPETLFRRIGDPR